MLTLGDRSQAFQSLQNGQRLKADLNRYSNELSTGKPADLAAHLSGRTAHVAGLDRDIARIDGFLETSSTLATMFDRQQQSLGAVSDGLDRSAHRLVVLTAASMDSQIAAAEAEGLQTFTTAIAQLNATLGGRSLFAGISPDRAPLASADTILTALETEVAGLSSATDIARAVRDWFADTTGGFSAVAYRGATGDPAHYRLSESSGIDAAARADASELREALAASATAALSGRLSGLVSRDARVDLLQAAGTHSFEAAHRVHALAARVGEDQALIETERVRLSAQRTVFASARNDNVLIDPFEAATRLQDAQQSLELHYAATARLLRLSLANYL